MTCRECAEIRERIEALKLVKTREPSYESRGEILSRIIDLRERLALHQVSHYWNSVPLVVTGERWMN